MVTHVLKSGEVTKDLNGHKVTRKEVPEYYDIVNRLKEEANAKRS